MTVLEYTLLGILLLLFIFILSLLRVKEFSFWGSRISFYKRIPQPENIVSKEPGTNESNLSRPESFEDFKLSANKRNKLAPEQIIFTESAGVDLSQKDISTDEIISFLQKEYTNHDKMFIASFDCAQVNFNNFTLVFSWNEAELVVERLVAKHEFVFEEKWSKSLFAYRLCLKLSYRNSIKVLYNDLEIKKTIRQYDELIRNVDDYIASYNRKFPKNVISKIDLSILLNEAEFFYEKGDIRACVSKFEMILSNVHKVLLYNPVRESMKDAIMNNEFKLEGKEIKKKRVLILDDESSILILLERYFASQKCFENIEFEFYTNLKEAIDKIYQEKYDLIITDIIMPYCSGIEIGELNKSLYRVPCIGMSGYCPPANPFTSFLQKPFSLEQLKKETAKHLGLAEHNISDQHKTAST